MNNAQFDHLLQATAPRLESLTGSARARDTGPPFDNLFRQASVASTSSPQAPAPSSSSSSSSQSGASTIKAPATDSQSDDRPASSSSSLEADTRTDSATETPDPELADAVASDNSEDPGDEPQENAEVVALLAAEQASKVKVVDTPALEIDGEAFAIDADAAADEAGSDPKSKSTDAKSKAAISSPATNDVKPVESVDLVKDVESPADNSLATLEAAVAKSKQDVADGQAAASEETSAIDQIESKPLPKSEEKPHRNSEQVTYPASQQSAEHASAQPAAKVASAALSTESAKSAPSVEHVDSPKSEKKSTARTDSTVRDAASAPTERPANIPRVAEPSTGTAIAANVQQPPAIDSANAAAASPAVKSAGGTTESKPGILSSLNRLDRSAAPGARGANRPGQAESGPNVDPARFISRVARAVQTAQERGAPLQLRLSPPELGAMRLELSMNQGALTATIETDNTNAKQLLLDNLPALRDRLSDQNIKIERFDVDVRRDPSGNQQNHAPQDRDQQQRNHANSSFDGARRQAAAATLDEPQPLRRTISTTSINVVA